MIWTTKNNDNEPLSHHRRVFLRFLAASPLFASVKPLWSLIPQASEDLITSPTDAINVFDFQKVAQSKLPPAHYGYLATGVGDDSTLRANREGFQNFQLRMRRLIDIRRIDLSTEIFGTKWESPILFAPVGSQKAFHPEGEMAVARAAREKGILQILSTVTTSSVEEVNGALGRPVWYQLYPTTEWSVTRSLVKRAESAGCSVLVLTVDLRGGTNRETLKRWIKRDQRQCSLCHGEGDRASSIRRKPMLSNLDLSRITGLMLPEMTWNFIQRLRDTASMKVVVKGIVTWEDAELCIEHGVDGIIVSNHGGRAEESGRSTIECLSEVVTAVRGRIPVLIDSGFRRGTDIFKALALGASGICIGRPYLWGLASFGQEGVEATLDLLRAELERVMKQAGTTSIEKITSAYLVDRSH